MNPPGGAAVDEAERFTRALLARIDSGGSVESQGALLLAGLQATVELLEMQRVGFVVSRATIAFALEQISEGTRRLLDLADERLLELELQLKLEAASS